MVRRHAIVCNRHGRDGQFPAADLYAGPVDPRMPGFGASEIIVTLMLALIAVQILNYLLLGLCLTFRKDQLLGQREATPRIAVLF